MGHAARLGARALAIADARVRGEQFVTDFATLLGSGSHALFEALSAANDQRNLSGYSTAGQPASFRHGREADTQVGGWYLYDWAVTRSV